ncbi:hypothetical protein K490DRAFT_59568 [Saccharata proteae CBS 121410]|uniref:Uncharacterized protein n=1 Tax=Saccharata proteae CBS 121410 TaxID=1314787 RepID=A0A9P4LWX0_9PEZI|nr:hypothetical protein K490DRAFT_59568 [Saccharata proteae CBS 121410]
MAPDRIASQQSGNQLTTVTQEHSQKTSKAQIAPQPVKDNPNGPIKPLRVGFRISDPACNHKQPPPGQTADPVALDLLDYAVRSLITEPDPYTHSMEDQSASPISHNSAIATQVMNDNTRACDCDGTSKQTPMMATKVAPKQLRLSPSVPENMSSDGARTHSHDGIHGETPVKAASIAPQKLHLKLHVAEGVPTHRARALDRDGTGDNVPIMPAPVAPQKLRFKPSVPEEMPPNRRARACDHQASASQPPIMAAPPAKQKLRLKLNVPGDTPTHDSAPATKPLRLRLAMHDPDRSHGFHCAQDEHSAHQTQDSDNETSSTKPVKLRLSMPDPSYDQGRAPLNRDSGHRDLEGKEMAEWAELAVLQRLNRRYPQSIARKAIETLKAAAAELQAMDDDQEINTNVPSPDNKRKRPAMGDDLERDVDASRPNKKAKAVAPGDPTLKQLNKKPTGFGAQKENHAAKPKLKRAKAACDRWYQVALNFVGIVSIDDDMARQHTSILRLFGRQGLGD